MDRYAELREVVKQQCSAILIEDVGTIRALLAERDALRKALHGSDNQLREVLASITDERVHFDGDEFHACLAANRAALAQEQGGSNG